MTPPGSVAELLERLRFPFFVVDASRVTIAAGELRPGMLLRVAPDDVQVIAAPPLPPWEPVRELLEERDA